MTCLALGACVGGEADHPDAPPVVGGSLSLTEDELYFAVVGDTRPAVSDDTAGYPTSVITKIWQDVQAVGPRPPFALTTGDYVYASISGSEASAQLDIYMRARSSYEGPVYAALGNHECTTATASNCGTGTLNGASLYKITRNYSAFGWTPFAARLRLRRGAILMPRHGMARSAIRLQRARSWVSLSSNAYASCCWQPVSRAVGLSPVFSRSRYSV